MGTFDLLKEWEISIPDVHCKYKVGEKSDVFEDVKELKPVFSFDYVSLKGGTFCFNGSSLGRKDYTKLIQALKNISSHTYKTLNDEYRFHFHNINWDPNQISINVYTMNTTERKTSPHINSKYSKKQELSAFYTKEYSILLCLIEDIMHTREKIERKNKI